MNNVFPEIKKNFGFGMMRFIMENDELDYDSICEMIDAYLEAGFNYFDTAHGYLNKKSEVACNKCLTSRYPRDKYVLTDKLSNGFFKTREDIRPLFEEQLKICGVDYFDFYLMHAQNRNSFEFFKSVNAYEEALKFKEEGKIRHFGISFHDTSDILDKILTEYPQIEVVQLQFNYLDFDDDSVQSGKCYEVCQKHNKPVIVMEPVKGGNLANPPQNVKLVFDALQDNKSYASYAIRFAAGFENVVVVLSGMNTLDMVKENVSFMKDFEKLNEKEEEAIKEAALQFRAEPLISCTGCRYCVSECPQEILIPDLFSLMNAKNISGSWNQNFYYNVVYTANNPKASECLGCGACEDACPQHLNIRELLEKVAETFEKDNR